MKSRELSVAHQTPGECSWCDSRYEQMRDAFAHELAEQIRALDPIEAALAGQNAWNDAADLIDPEVN